MVSENLFKKYTAFLNTHEHVSLLVTCLNVLLLNHKPAVEWMPTYTKVVWVVSSVPRISTAVIGASPERRSCLMPNREHGLTFQCSRADPCVLVVCG